jgi:hypothetical protein
MQSSGQFMSFSVPSQTPSPHCAPPSQSLHYGDISGGLQAPSLLHGQSSGQFSLTYGGEWKRTDRKSTV